MSDEPTLPRLPAVSWDERSQSFSNNPRKRGRYNHASNAPSSAFNSSDPAVFSSDDDPAIDNYVEGRRKKRYVGTWFSQHPTSSDSTFGDTDVTPRPKRTFARQMDSGVFLGSDDAESETMSECPLPPTQPRLRQLEVRPRQQINAAELRARERIREYVDSGTEDVVLYSAGLTELSNDTIAPLSQLTRIPIVGRDVAFEQHPTQIRLNLASNALTKLPGALFDVANITMLSLRGNLLEELPPGIGKLSNLQSLNISQNRLKYLPTELLDLLSSSTKLDQAVLHPNPFLEACDDYDSMGFLAFAQLHKRDGEDSSMQKTPLSPRFISSLLGRSAARVYDSRGRLLRGPTSFEEPGGLVRMVWEDDFGDEPGRASGPSDSARRSTMVPSLMEAVLRTCYDTEHLVKMQELLQDGLPHLQGLLQRAHEQKQSGGVRCSKCGRIVVVPAREWIEWRQLLRLDDGPYALYLTHSRLSSEAGVPFLHRACSARCSPEDGNQLPLRIPWGWKIQRMAPFERSRRE